MQSVKISIVIGDNNVVYSNKGIFNNIRLMSNVSVIICVPRLIKNNCYSDIDTVTEPMQCNNYSTTTVVADTNNFGAFKRVVEDESQCLKNKLDSNIYSIVIVNSIQINQMIGEMPNYCIPVKNNAITVQGISYSDPSSFNLNTKMASGAPQSKNKSDYAFKTSCIIEDEAASCQRKREAQAAGSQKGENVKRQSPTSSNVDHDNKRSDTTSIECIATFPVQMRTFSDGTLTFDAMLKCAQREGEMMTELRKTDDVNGWGVPHRLRLCGGGESSLSNASGWGSPPASNNNAGNWGNSANGQGTANNPQQQWSGTGQRPAASQPDMNSNKGNNNAVPPTSSAGGNWQTSPPTMPVTPNNNAPQQQPNNGTSNSTGGNSGGNNSPNGPANGNLPPGNNGTNAANSMTSSTKIEQLNSMREALFSQDGWGGQHVNQDTNWEVPGSPEPGVKVDAPPGAPPSWKPNMNNGTDLWEANLRNGGQPPTQPTPKTPWGHTPTTNIGGTWGEDDDAADSPNVWTGPPPPQQWNAGPPQQPQQWGAAKKDDWGAWGEPQRPPDIRYDNLRVPDPRQPPPDPRHDQRGDVRGISGRLNGDMWGQHHPNAPAPNKMMPGGGVNQWNVPVPKDLVKGAGWEEPSPPAARRTAGGFDDGTSLWSQRPGAGAMVAGRGVVQGPPVQQRGMPPTQGKPDAVWGQPPQRNNASWEEGHGPGWPEQREAPAWPDAAGPALGWPAPKPKPPGGPAGAWPDDIGEWGGPKPPQGPPGKQLAKDAIWNSKQFRVLCDMGYKKEDVEAALRRFDMNTEEALDYLSPMRGGSDGWRREEHFPPHHAPFPHQQQTLPSVSPAVVHKILSQPAPPQHHQPPFNHPNSGGGNSGQPSSAQLRMLVQQIQMAVTAGYLNHQILNQPLAPQTLVLLNQLLQAIKALQNLVAQHSLAISKNNSTLSVHCSVQISKTKQQISTLQNQIAAQQAIYVKQQSGGGDLFSKQQHHDPLSHLQNNLSEMGISKEPQGYGGGSNQQSRLNQWKLPSLDKEGEGSEFSRAPGTAKSATSPTSLNLGLQPDSTWGRSGVGEPWGEGSTDVADGKDSWPVHPSHQAVYDLVPEFEPGKPWKGHQMKNIEDDPAMTPGSVVRSPLSLAAIKDSDMLGGKASPPAGERSLSSSTWSYPPPAPAAAKPPADAWAGNKRGPPPGLNKAWPQQQQQHHQRNIPAWQCTWLLLKNLTAQIDGSTLKTLCMQHGPLLNFHLYLNQGIALARYSTREEASKAQTALNNCVLSNTTIFAESPGESDVQMIIQHLGQSGGVGGVGGGGAWRGTTSKDAAWGFPSLWSQDSHTHDQRSTPSSLNSFLPPDLLGGESI